LLEPASRSQASREVLDTRKPQRR